MTTPTLKKFMALYLVPAPVIADWGKTDPEVKRAAEQKVQGEWQKWLGDHAKSIALTEAGGKTKRLTVDGVSDTKNDILLYSIVDADTHEAAAKIFENHPHLQIPQASIEVMELKPMGPRKS